VILLDTHIWVWWVHGVRLSSAQLEKLSSFEEQGLGVSIISCWEVAKLCERGRLKLQRPLREWLDLALAYPGARLVDLTKEVVVESANLPGDFHRDPADQLIVATARVNGWELATADRQILGYPEVETINFRTRSSSRG
jgi:PIN domain nuclease of toxin-antitoxin system